MFCIKCGHKLNDSDLYCSKCGTKTPCSMSAASVPAEDDKTKYAPVVKNGLKLPPKRMLKLPPKGVIDRCMKQSAAQREVMSQSGMIGQSLGERSAAGDALMEGLRGDSFSGCLFMPLVILNPLFWCQWYYRSKAKGALEAGDIDEAQRMKGVSTKFAIAGWALIVAVLFFLYNAYCK